MYVASSRSVYESVMVISTVFVSEANTSDPIVMRFDVDVAGECETLIVNEPQNPTVTSVTTRVTT